MYLSRLSVKNYKCLVDIDIPLTPIHVLIGENDAGKTSLLEAIAALYSSWEQEDSEIFPRPWGGRELVFHGSKEPRIELDGQWTPSADQKVPWGELLYGMEIDFQREGLSHKAKLWISVNGKKKSCRMLPVRSQLPEIRQELRSVPFPHGLDALDATLGATSIFSLDTGVMALPAAFSPERRYRLDPDGFGLPTLLDDILGYNADLFLDLRSQFCRSFPQFRSVRVELETGFVRQSTAAGIQMAGQSTGKGIYFDLSAGGSIRARQASDGVILMLAFLAMAHVPNPPKLLLIEEPENGIYPKRLEEVVTLLKSMVQRTEGVRFPQIILSTHSPYVLSFFEPEEVTFLSRDPKINNAGVRARPMKNRW